MDDKIYTLLIGGRAVLCFPAASLNEARSLPKEEWLRDDLREATSGGSPLWDGQEKVTVRNAGTDEIARYEIEARTLTWADELPIVYLVARTRTAPSRLIVP